MGFFDKLFGGKTEQEETVKFFGQSKTVLTPIRGKVLAQADIPDETFAQGILGPGCGIEPTGKTVYAPFDGTVDQVASTLHAVGLTSEDGIEILIHVAWTPWRCRARASRHWSRWAIRSRPAPRC